MRRLLVCTNVSLDGVMQAPGRPDEDRRGGFTHGGWAAPFAAMAQVGDVFASADALLLGRRTYEDFYHVWPKRPESPFSSWMTNIRKYVASRTLHDPLPWANSVVLAGDIRSALETVKGEDGGDLLIMGSGELVRSLIPLGIIDEFVLLIHPIVLGSGCRLFPDDGTFANLTLRDSSTTSTGVVVGRYLPQDKTDR
jgi:dihydrofolate reductase